jgi:hydroxymethylpyrimidine pyrophosphatase-like HAD family hydrolase
MITRPSPAGGDAPAAGRPLRLPETLRRAFDLIIFDWDGTAVPDRAAAVPELTASLEALLELGTWLCPVTGTHVGNLERQSLLSIAPATRRRLYVCTNRGSEVFAYDDAGARITAYLRRASGAEDRALTLAADELQRRLRDRRLQTAAVYDRLNRRKVDLIPLPEWRDPPKAHIAALIEATAARVREAGFAQIADVMHLAERIARSAGLPDPRITSDGKYVEIGLTDKSDSIAWLIDNVANTHGIAARDILVVGDEFGDVGGFAGSDERMVTQASAGAVIVSVGREPNGVPPGVIHVPGGSRVFLEILRWQSMIRRT